MNFSILLPTRGRPDRVETFLDSIEDTADNVDRIEVVIRIDRDDDLMMRHKFKPRSLVFRLLIGPRAKCLSDCWNECWRHSKNDILMLAGDDLIFRTPLWDSEIRREIKSFPYNIGLVYGADNNPYRRKNATHPFVHRTWTELVGYFTPPNLDYGNDTWLEMVAKKINRITFRPDILIEHMHYRYKKRNRDQTDVDLRNRYKSWGGGEKFYTLEHLIDHDAEKLKRSIS